MFETFLAHCQPLLEGGSAPLAGALFLGGLAGSLTHCGVMCAPFAISAATAHGQGSALHLQRMLLPYHLGRITTYAALGAAAGGAAALLVAFPWFGVLSRWLVALAAAIFVLVALVRLPLPMPAMLQRHSGCVVQRMGQLLRMRSHWARYGMGVLLGFLPCGLLVAALMAVAASGSAWQGGIGMVAFGLGTVPVLSVLAQGGGMFARRVPAWALHGATLLMGIHSFMVLTTTRG